MKSGNMSHFISKTSIGICLALLAYKALGTRVSRMKHIVNPHVCVVWTPFNSKSVFVIDLLFCFPL